MAPPVPLSIWLAQAAASRASPITATAENRFMSSLRMRDGDVGVLPGTTKPCSRSDSRRPPAPALVRAGRGLIVKGRMAPAGPELIARMAQGDTQALARFYDRYAPLAYALI